MIVQLNYILLTIRNSITIEKKKSDGRRKPGKPGKLESQKAGKKKVV